MSTNEIPFDDLYSLWKAHCDLSDEVFADRSEKYKKDEMWSLLSNAAMQGNAKSFVIFANSLRNLYNDVVSHRRRTAQELMNLYLKWENILNRDELARFMGLLERTHTVKTLSECSSLINDAYWIIESASSRKATKSILKSFTLNKASV